MIDKLNYEKLNGLVPAVVQDVTTHQVLMVGFMNRDAVEATTNRKRVTFWSRTKNRLWEKGETSGNTLELVSLQVDCDGDALLIQAKPAGPVCHTGSYTCFGEGKSGTADTTLAELERIIRQRAQDLPADSYTAKLLEDGTARIAQKVGEEAVEMVVAALQKAPEAIREEAADLLYHLLVLLQDRGIRFEEVGFVLQRRMNKKPRE